MPELPDVETFKRYLDATALHQSIAETEVFNERVLEGVRPADMKKALSSRQFNATHRHGKYLFAHLDDAQWLVLHFGMTGRLKYYKVEDSRPQHIRLQVRFTNGYHLAYDCQRMFGSVTLAADTEQFIQRKKLGPDALRLSWSEFRQAFQGRRGRLKPALMNQHILAGIGNVYSDEILFQMELHPELSVARLSKEQMHRLYTTTQDVLQTAVDARADPERFPNHFITPHRHDEGTCPRDGQPLQRITVSGRSAYICPRHQPAPD
ncbi:MAG: Fpg/Nei family DNA glycosylase [Candidatus Methanospirareceae archaeon]